MLSGFFFTFILVELRNKWILAFWIIICPFSTQKCQCSTVSLASVLENMDSGMFVMLKVFTDYFCIVFACRLLLPLLAMFTVSLDFLSEDIIRDKSNSVHGLGNVSGCVSHDCFFKISCSSISVAMIAIHGVHSHHFHWPVATIAALPCTPHIYTLSVWYSLFQVYVWSRLLFAKYGQFLLGGCCCRIQVHLVSAQNLSSCG